MRFASLGSGSKGNATVIDAGGVVLLLDCGFSIKETVKRLARLALNPEQIQGILLTHEHGDHSAGAASFARRYKIPLFLTPGTAQAERNAGRLKEVNQVRYLVMEEAIKIGDLEFMPIAVPHDAREPCQFIFRYNGRALGVLTDVGSITSHMIEMYEQCSSLLLEANHDRKMLADGPYPLALKKRVGGDWGHLSNCQAAAFLEKLEPPPEILAVAHISEQNNDSTLAMETLARALEWPVERVHRADQEQGLYWINVA